MAFQSSRSRDRARRRNALLLALLRGGFVLGSVAVIAYAAYQGGLALADLKLVGLRQDLATVTRERDTARAARETAEAALGATNERLNRLQASYDTDVPKPPLTELMQLARERLNDGTTAERIADALRAVRAATPCEGRPTSRRIVIRAGAQPVTDDTASFAEGLISLFVTPSADDPARALTAHFTRFGGAPLTISGPAPLRATIPVDNAELRFTVALSDVRGFASITLNSCAK